MPLDLSGLAQISGAAAGAAPDAQLKWIRVQQAQQELDAVKRAIAAEAAAGGTLPAQVPQPSMPGTSSMPAPTPLPGTPGYQPTASPVLASPAGQGGGGAAVPSGPQPTLPGTPGAGGISIGQMAAQIKAANAGIDNATLFEAVKAKQALLNPYERQMLQFLEAQQRLGESARRTDLSHEDRVAALQQRDQQFEVREKRIAQRTAASMGGLTPQQKQLVKAQEATLNAQRKSIQDQISALNAQGVDPSDPRLLQLYQRRDQIDAQSEALLARVEAATGGKGTGGAGAGTAAPSAAVPVPTGRGTTGDIPLPSSRSSGAAKSGPKGAPDPRTLRDGQTGTDTSDGSKWVVRAGKWVRLQ